MSTAASSSSFAFPAAADSGSDLSATEEVDDGDEALHGLGGVDSTSLTSDDDDDADALPSRSSSPAASSAEPKSVTAAVRAAPSIAYFVCLLYAFCVMGFDMGLLGPSLLEMAAQVNGTISALSFVLAARSAGLLTGTLIAGYFIDRKPNRGNLILLTGVVSISTVTAFFPFIDNLYLLVVMGWVHGVTMGLVDNTSQILLIRHFGDKVAPYMQALHCAFGAGALFSPLVLSPFLSNTAAPTDTLPDGTAVVYDVTFHWAWIIMAAIGLPCALWMLYYTAILDFAASPASPSTAPAAADDEDGDELRMHDSELGWHEAGQTSKAVSAADEKAAYRYQLYVVLNVGVFLSLYVGCETGYGSYIYSYAVTQLGVSADSGAYINSGYWGSFTVGRFLGIFVSLYCSPQQMVLADLLGCILAVIVIMAFQSSFAALWLGTVVYGLSVGSVYASAINYTERLVGVSGRLLSYLTFFAALGDAVVPLTIGSVFDTSVGGRAMMWVVVAVAATATATFAYLCWWVHAKQASDRRDEQQTEPARAAAAEHDDGADGLDGGQLEDGDGVDGRSAQRRVGRPRRLGYAKLASHQPSSGAIAARDEEGHDYFDDVQRKDEDQQHEQQTPN